MPEEFLQKVYDLETQEATDAYYTAWAGSYDDELGRQGYRSPGRCAAALASFAPHDGPVLDVGCGTGISGVALRAAGFSVIDGQDVNAEMLARAASAGIYRDTWVTDLTDPFPFAPDAYAAFAAIGVIGVGAAPPSLLAQALHALAPGGFLVFSYNDHALARPEFAGALEDALSSGLAEQLFCETGPHLEGLGTNSNVYVLRRC